MRPPLPTDVETCLKVVPTLIQALVELCSVRVGLRGTLLPMELSQHIMQALPFDAYHYPLLQVPHFTVDLVARCTKVLQRCYRLSKARSGSDILQPSLSVLRLLASFPSHLFYSSESKPWPTSLR